MLKDINEQTINSIYDLIANIGEENFYKHIEALKTIYSINGKTYVEKENNFCDIVIKKVFEIFDLKHIDPANSQKRCIRDTDRTYAYIVITYILVVEFKIPVNVVMEKLKKMKITIYRYLKKYYNLDKRIKSEKRVLDICKNLIINLKNINNNIENDNIEAENNIII